MSAAGVIAGERKWACDCADLLAWLPTLPADSVDLVLGSPPYEAARTYGIDFKLRGQEWVDWMVRVFQESLRICRGLVAFVLEGQTRQYRWSAVPALLMADLHRAGVHLRKPPAFHRVGIPGSGGPDWLRNDYEFIVCATRGGKLPWSDNTACGHPPKWAPGGEMSHRLSDGTRCNQWGKCGTEAGVNGSAQRTRDGERQKASRPSHVMSTKAGDSEPPGEDMYGEPIPDETPIRRDAFGMQSGNRRRPDGKREATGKPKTRLGRGIANGIPGSTKGSVGKKHTKAKADGDEEQVYLPPVLANPGNVIHCKVGGGLMGHELAHENEAPYPLGLAEFFVRSFAPPNGIVLDPFSGSGTTGHAAIKWQRRFIGCDVRQSQVDLTARRIESVTPMMFK